MSDNLELAQVTASQGNKDITINDQSGDLDAAQTETLAVVVDNTNAATITREGLQGAVNVVVTEDATPPDGKITLTVDTAFKRGLFVVDNQTGQTVELTVSGQTRPRANVVANDTQAVLFDGSDLLMPWSPKKLYQGGEAGALLDPTDISTLYQDSGGTTPVTAAGDPVGLMQDQSGNSSDASQTTGAARPTYRETPERIDMDQSDDNMDIDFGAAFTGVVLQGTPNGIVHMEIDDADGAWTLTQTPNYAPDGGEITGFVAVGGSLSAADINKTKAYLQSKGAGADYAGVTSMSEWFRDRADITKIYADFWDTSSVTTFKRFAQGCSSLTTLDVSNWDTSSVTNFNTFVRNCSSLTTLDVSNWDTSSVTGFDTFAQGCSSLTTLDVSNWDTSSVTGFITFAQGCSSLTTLDVSNWDTSSVTNFNTFVRGCSSLTTLDVSNWDTSSVTDFNNFVRDCSSLTTLDVSNWDTSSVTGFDTFAQGCSSLTTLDVSNWDTSSVTGFITFAQGCSSLTTLDVSNWDTSSVTNFNTFVRGCSSLTTLDVSNWDTSSVTDFNNFVRDCSSLTTVTITGGTGNPFADSDCTSYANAFIGTVLSQSSIDDILVAIESANTSNGTFGQSGGSAPSVTGETAIDALRTRGWTVSVTGGY